jgi:hypothetical protein
VAFAILGFVPNSSGQTFSFCADWAPHLLVFTLICTLITIGGTNPTTHSVFETDGDYPKELKKYSPPECKEKKDSFVKKQ